MRLLITSDSYLPRLGGGEYHVFYMLRELRDLGHDAVLFTTEAEPAQEPEEGVIRRPYGGIASLPALWMALWKASRGCDVIQGHYSYRLSFLAATVALLRRIPFVVTQHGLGLLPQVGETRFQRQVFRLWRWGSMRGASVIISTSDDLSTVIEELGFGHKIVHIPNGYDPQRFKPLPPPEEENPVLLTVRRLVPKNGIQYLVAALPRIRERFPGVRHICIGDGRLRDDVTALAARLGVLDRIEFLGPLGHEQLQSYYRKAHVVVIPSTAESTSLSCIEAMAMGKTVVASRVGGLIELLGANEERGYLVDLTEDEHCNYDAPFTLPAERIERLSHAIIHALTHPDEARAKAEAAAAYAPGTFAWQGLAKRTEEVLKRAASRDIDRSVATGK